MVFILGGRRVTATARALAWALQLSLNGFQVITDGCTYRRDQVPAAPGQARVPVEVRNLAP